jgi:hypothetical protein
MVGTLDRPNFTYLHNTIAPYRKMCSNEGSHVSLWKPVACSTTKVTALGSLPSNPAWLQYRLAVIWNGYPSRGVYITDCSSIVVQVNMPYQTFGWASLCKKNTCSSQKLCKEVITVHIAGNYSGESMGLSSNSLRTKKQGA